MICLRMGKTNTAKTLPSNFNVTTLENPLLSKQTFTSKEILVSYTNLQLNPYLNNQLHRSQYATLITNKRKLLAAKFFNSSKRWRSRRCLVIKPYNVQNTATSTQERWTRANSVSGHNLLEQILLNTCGTCFTFDGP